MDKNGVHYAHNLLLQKNLSVLAVKHVYAQSAEIRIEIRFTSFNSINSV